LKRIALPILSKRGQTTVETAGVLSGVIFMTFAIMNLGIVFHTKMIATYAAFMAGRSFQVLGDQAGASFFMEALDDNGGRTQEFLAEYKDAKNKAFVRVAEDIYTCALPWMTVPRADETESMRMQNPQEGPTTEERCRSGKRKYETLNIGQIAFKAWNEEQERAIDRGDSSGMILVKGGFAEGRRWDAEREEESLTDQARNPLSYGILELPFRTPILFGFGYSVDGKTPLFQSQVSVPVLLNPGLAITLEKDDSDRDAFEQSGDLSAGERN